MYIQTDKRNFRDTVKKGSHVPSVFALVEYGRTGFMAWPAIKAQGKLSIAVQPAAGETFTIDTKVYTFVAAYSNVDGAIVLGANVAATRLNVAAALNLTGAPGSQYAAAMTLHPTVSFAAAFSGNDLILTAKTGGTAGNLIATTETMAGAGNQFDAATLGTYRAGAAISDADSTLIPRYRGSFNASTGQEVATRETWYLGEIDGNTDRMLNNPHTWGASRMHDYIIKAGATRKIAVPNSIDRRYNRLTSLHIRSFLKRPQWQSGLNSPFTENTGNSIQKAFELDSSRFILFYYQNAGTTGVYAVVGSVASTGVITWGTPVLCTALGQTDTEFDAVLINTDKVLMTYGAGASTYTQCATLSISGTTITKNADVQITTTNFTQKNIVSIGTDKGLLVCQNSATLTAYVVTVTGTVPSYGAAATLASSNIYNGGVVGNGTDKAQMVYMNSSLTKTAVITASGTTVTFQTAITIGYNTTWNYKQHVLMSLNTDQFIYFTPSGYLLPDRSHSRARLTYITASGNTSSQITTNEIETAYFDANGRYFLKKIDNTNFMMYSNRDGARTFYCMKVTLSGSTLLTSDIFTPGAGYYDDGNNGPGNESPNRFRRFEEWSNIQRWCDPLYLYSGAMAVIVGTDNNLNGGLAACVDKTFSFDLYIDDDLLGTYQKTAHFMVEPIVIRQDLFRESFGLKIKSNESVDMHIGLPVALVEIE